jgi:hypothetical protein
MFRKFVVAGCVALSFGALSACAKADAPNKLTLTNHKFFPEVIRVKANEPNQVLLVNNDDTAEEFDSSSLKVEKVVGGHGQGVIRMRALAPGKYPFMGEYHSQTAQGIVIAE